jgi:hypothetical protein
MKPVNIHNDQIQLGRAVGRASSAETKNQICVQDFGWETRKEQNVRGRKHILEDIIKLDLQ